MLVAFHSPPRGFFNSGPPYGTEELLRLVEKAGNMGFRCFQIGPTSRFGVIDGDRLRTVLEKCDMKSNVHVGGLYDAEKFVASKLERTRFQKELHSGIELSREVSSPLVSFHPPFFKSANSEGVLSSTAKMVFLKLVREEADFAHDIGIKLALESFCYPPFIFNGLDDFIRFFSNFPLTRLGVLLEVGHLFQAGFNLDEAIQTFNQRLLDVHIHDATHEKDFRRATHLPLGKGTIDFSNLIRMLTEVGYDGWLTLEIRGTEREIIESREKLEDLLKQQQQLERTTNESSWHTC
jgi:sugar phosphate isomerase/epimerase